MESTTPSARPKPVKSGLVQGSRLSRMRGGIMKAVKTDAALPIIIGGVLTVGLMTVTIAAYVSGGGTSHLGAGTKSPATVPSAETQPISVGDVDQALDFSASQVKLLDETTPPKAADLSDRALGL